MPIYPGEEVNRKEKSPPPQSEERPSQKPISVQLSLWVVPRRTHNQMTDRHVRDNLSNTLWEDADRIVVCPNKDTLLTTNPNTLLGVFWYSIPLSRINAGHCVD